MKIQETVMQRRTVDIGPLDAALYLPMGGRIRRRMKTTCNVCYRAITDDFFIGGFKKGRPNLLLHVNCVDADVVSAAKQVYEQRVKDEQPVATDRSDK